MRSQVHQAHTIWQCMFHQVMCRLGEQDLPAMPGAHDAGGSMHIQAHVAFGGQGWFAGVQAHAHTHSCTFRPGMAGKRTLGVHCC